MAPGFGVAQPSIAQPIVQWVERQPKPTPSIAQPTIQWVERQPKPTSAFPPIAQWVMEPGFGVAQPSIA
jgi:hypothetical protein